MERLYKRNAHGNPCAYNTQYRQGTQNIFLSNCPNRKEYILIDSEAVFNQKFGGIDFSSEPVLLGTHQAPMATFLTR